MKSKRELRFYPNQRFIDAKGRKFTVMGAWCKPDIKTLEQTIVEFFQDGSNEVIERPVDQIRKLFSIGRLKWIEEHPSQIWPPIKNLNN